LAAVAIKEFSGYIQIRDHLLLGHLLLNLAHGIDTADKVLQVFF
jgi:hypothetical protein